MNEIYKLTIFGTGFEICVGEIEKSKFEYCKRAAQPMPPAGVSRNFPSESDFITYNALI